jgi:putative membrane protein
LRFSLRRPRPWESTSLKANSEYRRRYMRIAEDQTTLEAELTALLGADAAGLGSGEPAPTFLHLQARQFDGLLKDAVVPAPVYAEFMKVLRDCHDQQARCDRIKNTPYPRQYAIVTTMFVAIFCTLLPFGVVPMFAAINVAAIPSWVMVGLSVPFSVLLGWMYFSLDLVGESTANPFEGNANDVPLSQICRDIEIELRGRLGETNLPPPLLPVRGIAT